ncbi:uncharacterized protein KY384_005229 [Bacidia gigantensis]|uniref:uncharacterized protein n=1 Tax=Bacidia gigantensis TaxID=2732470 RepID=UPI001D049285|nr:uncharacterized protein KY384_005229 [Bacidia gigantensis]KAG8529748.1 hypothetical protein KY384_005229 [Bacidia gigantensis]
MPPLNIHSGTIRRSSSFLQAGFAARKLPDLRPPITWRKVNAPHQRLPYSTSPRFNNSSQSQPPQEKKPSPSEALSSALQDADPAKINLLSPVHVPEDPNGVLNEKHPAFGILANSSIVVTRQLELMDIMIGFEQANKYVIMDPQGQHIGFMAEKDLGMGNMMKRQFFSTHRSFETHVFDRHGKEVLRFHRPFSWISSRIGIYDPVKPGDYAPSSSTAVSPITPGGLSTDINADAARISQLPLSEMQIIGEAQQQWAPLRRKYNLFIHRNSPDPSTQQLTSGTLPLSNTTALEPSSSEAPNSGGEYGQFAYVDERWLSWDFSLMSSDQKLLGSVNRNFKGFGREIFTDTGVYALRMDAAGLAEEPNHLISKTGQMQPAETPGMTLDQRAVMLATAVSIDFDYFSRKAGGGGLMGGMWPVWLPGGGEAAGAGAAEAGAAEAGAEAGAVEGTADKGLTGYEVDGLPGKEGSAAAGAGSLAGYEAMQRGAYGEQEQQPPQEQEQPYQGEDSQDSPDMWGRDNNPWSQDSGDAGGAGGGDGGGSWFDDLLNS